MNYMQVRTFIHIPIGICIHPFAILLVPLEESLVAIAVLVRGDAEALLHIHLPSALVAIAVATHSSVDFPQRRTHWPGRNCAGA